MIRVLYRWRVAADRQDDFMAWWHEGTLRIRESQPGSRGSTLLRPSDSGSVVGLARWESEEQLHAFRERMGLLEFAGATLESMEILEEVDHLTTE